MITSKKPDTAPQESVDTEGGEKALWPLGYRLQQPTTPDNQSLQAYGFKSGRPARKWWSHKLYRGPNNEVVEILYSRTKEQSEVIAQHFLNEPILGFDMEWPWNDWKRKDLQNKIGLIQVASEAKIGLFHIGLHPGKTTDEIIAPTLRKIIESPNVGKVGVNILNADFGRLRRFFGLNPKGAVESSHLYRLIKYGTHSPGYVSVKMVSLARQVEDQLSLPLYKGDVRTSNWSRPLSKEQIQYAAGDAYAGFMLYHCMNAKRLSMKPVPGLPVFAEKYKGKSSKDDPILLDAGDGATITSEAFFGVKPIQTKLAESKANVRKEKSDSESSNPNSFIENAIFANLVQRRAILAGKDKIPATRIISDEMLKRLARERPSDTNNLLSIKGIDQTHQQKYGEAWLEVIALFTIRNDCALSTNNTTDSSKDITTKSPENGTKQRARTPRRTRIKQQAASNGSPDSLPACGDPGQRPPPVPTGLSFTLAETRLDAGSTEANISRQPYDSDDSLPSLDFGSPSPRLKRKRMESPIPHTVSGKFQKPAQSCDDKHASIPPSLMGGVESNSPHRITTAKSDMVVFTPRSRISRNKLLAFSRLVTRELPARSAHAPPVVVTDSTLDQIIIRAPRTQEDLEKIVGIDSFLCACKQTNRDLLRNIIKFAPTGT